MNKLGTLALAFLFFSMSASHSQAAEKSPSKRSELHGTEVETSGTTAKPPTATGLKARIDPASGGLVPPQSEARGLNIMTPNSPFGIRNRALMWTEHMNDGSLTLHTEGQVQMASFARISESGEVQLHCEPVSLKKDHDKREAKQ